MKKYNDDELGYFGLSEQRLYAPEDYEQQLDEEELEHKVKEESPTNTRKKDIRYKHNTEDISIDRNDDDASIAESLSKVDFIALNPDEIKSGDLLQTRVDQWSNAILIPHNTLFTAISAPKRINRIAKAGTDKTHQEYFVQGKVLLHTGQQIDVRVNIINCRKPDSNIAKGPDDDLKW